MKHTDIQSVLRSYGGPSQERTPHRDLLKAQLLRSEYFASTEDAGQTARAQSQMGAIQFSWVGLLQRLSVAAVPAVAFVLIIAIVVTNYSPLTAQQVLAKAADSLEDSAARGRVHHSKVHLQMFYDGVTDKYNDTTYESWLNLETYDTRMTIRTTDGLLLEDMATFNQGSEMYRSPDGIFAQRAQGIQVEGPLVEPGGPVEQKLAQNPVITGVGAGGGGAEIDSSTFSACVEGSPEPCNDVIIQEVPPGVIEPGYGAAPGYVGATPGEDDETLIGGLYGIGYQRDPATRAEIFRKLGESPRAKSLGKIEWHGREAYGITVKYWTLPQVDTFYLDAETYALVGIETISRGGLFAGALELRSIMEVLEERYSDDLSEVSTEGLEPYVDPYLEMIKDLDVDAAGDVIIPPEGVIPE
ncbi:MAG: hypothetical protein V1895_02820 [Parcubacteria group bacterium]